MSKKIHIHTKGIIAELRCCHFLIQNKYKILHRRFKTNYGEIDIIAFKENEICMIEVKYRHLSLDLAREAVNKSIKRMYETYLAVLYDQYPNLHPRFKYFAISKNNFEFGDIDSIYEAN